MTDRKTVYFSDDDEELVEWIEEVADDVFGSESDLFKKSVKFFKEERGDQIDMLKTDEDSNTTL